MNGLGRLGGVTVLRDPAFRRYYLGSGIESAGAALAAVILPLAVFDRTRSPSTTALVPVLQVTPTLVFGLVAGAVADRLPRRVVMVTAAAVGAAALLGLAVATAAGAGLVGAALGCAAVVFSATIFFDSAEFAAVPAMVGRDRVVEAQTLLQTTNRLMLVVVPAAGAALYGLTGPVPLFAAGATAFAAAAVLLLTVRRGQLDRGTGRQQRRTGLGADIRDGLAYLWRHRLIRSLAVIGTCNAVAGGAVAGILVVYADRAFRIHPGNPALGALYVAAAVGSVAGGASLPVLRQRYRVVTVTLASLVASTVLMVALVVAPAYPVAVACYGLWQGGYGLVINNGQALRMQILPDRYQSRVGTAARMLSWGGSPLGALLAGFAADRVPIRWVLLLAVAALLAGVVLAVRARRLLADTDPRPVPAAPLPLEVAGGFALSLLAGAATVLADGATRVGLRQPVAGPDPRHRSHAPTGTRFARPGPPGRHHRP